MQVDNATSHRERSRSIRPRQVGGIVYEVYEVCDVCDDVIKRDIHREAGGAARTAEWLGLCGCANRRWRWRSASGEGPWELLGLA